MSDLSELIDLLSSKTNEGKLHWHLDGERRVFVKQGDSIIDIDKFGASGFRIAVRNADGLILANMQAPVGASETQKLSDIFDKVRHDALGVDKALDALKSSLLQL